MRTPGGQIAALVVQQAAQDAVAYHQAGYDPLHAPGVVAAQPMLGQHRGELTWISAVRGMMAVNLVLNLISVYVVVWEVKSLPTLAKSGFATGFTIAAFIATVIALPLGIGFIVLAKHTIARVLYLVLSCVVLFEAVTRATLASSVLFGLVLGIVYTLVLVVSLIAPRGRLGGLRFDAMTAAAFGVIVVVLGVVDWYLAVSSFNSVWIKVIPQ
jgi:hypothetical protein